MSVSEPTAPRFTVLDGLRGVAALVVITDHVPSPLLQTLLPGRYLAVDFFFALSGFVLAHVYGARLGDGLSWPRFMSARAVRLFPLYIFATLLAASLAFIGSEKGWNGSAPVAHVVASTLFGLVMLPCPPLLSIWPDAPFPLIGPAWSLFFELVANLGFALFIRRLNVRALLVIMAVNAVLLTITALLIGKLDSGFAWSNFAGGFFRVGYGFFAGVLVYRLRRHWTAPTLPAWGAFVLLLAVFSAPAQGPWRAVFDAFAAIVIMPCLVAMAADASVNGAARAICAALGTLSYGFYVLQVPVRDWLPIMLAHIPGANPELHGALAVALVAGVTILLAWVLNYLYDVPVRRMLSGKPVRASPIVKAPGRES